MGRWSLDDIPWQDFDPTRVDPEIVPIIKASSMVEYNAAAYRTYLRNVFSDDWRFRAAIEGWAEEEIQHGRALGRWAELADPDFDFEASFRRFTDGYTLPLDASQSVRGSRTGELIARCMVETGTSSYYSVLTDAVDEPVLKAICGKIAEDEYAHYCLFHAHLTRYLKDEKLGVWRRLRVVVGRIRESEDDELAYAYYAANNDGEPYDRRTSGAAYGSRAISICTPRHIERGTEMIFRTIGIPFDGLLGRSVTRLAWWILRARRIAMVRAMA